MSAVLRLLRFLRPTPNGVLIALPIAEGLLFVADRYDWFAFNRLKGYSVLVAAAVAAGALLLLLGWFLLSMLQRLKFQFGLRSLLLLTVAAAILCGWLTAELEAARRQRDAVARLSELGFYCTRVDPRNAVYYPTGNRFVGGMLGADFFLEVTELRGGWPRPNDDGKWIDELTAFTALERLDLPLEFFSDAGLKKIAGLQHLREVRLSGPHMTDEGLEQLGRLPHLESLALYNANVTGSFLAKCDNRAGLICLELTSPLVTDASLRPLAQAKRLRKLNLAQTSITDDGLAALVDLPELSRLNIAHTQVTPVGLRQLKGAAERLKLSVTITQEQLLGEDVSGLQKLGIDIRFDSQ